MDWNKLMSKQRLCQERYGEEHRNRSEFQKDYDRIVFSSPFRRLQDKAQVFPLSNCDYVRTRLTHSLEASCVGRSLGSIAGECIINKYKLTDINVNDFSMVTSTACLAHDIGNTPLGHSGEFAIREWFKSSRLGSSIIKSIKNKQQKNDLLNYEGNAHGFRYLTNLEWPSQLGGLQLTYAVLGAFVKYPCPSYIEGGGKHFYKNKFSFFYEEEGNFSKVASGLGLNVIKDEKVWCRHPLAFLVEAADDICYHIIDVEDGHRLGQISYGEARELLLGLLDKDRVCKVIDRMDNDKNRIEYLRAVAINFLIKEVGRFFCENIDSFTCGEFQGEITKKIPCRGEFLEFKRLAQEKVYTARQVVEIEVAGFTVVEKLLDYFVSAVEEKYKYEYKNKKLSSRAKSILHLIPESFIGKKKIPESDQYCRVLKIVDYVSGMTDSFAVSVFKKLSGILL